MGYQALLFCPDEKTARTVTQVLSELDFAVVPCTEPFAAVKKLMGEHFDAVVVDCDNEQNATLLFKSARNTINNQSSLAVAVVEGQAGVAKAFRIGANLVLTKPINVEQAKGTVRVARGLLRKSEGAKPAPGAAGAAMKPAAAVPAPPKPAPQATVPMVSSARPSTPPRVVAAVPSEITESDADVLEVSEEIAAPSMAKSAAQVSAPKIISAASAPAASAAAASAPAPAREPKPSISSEVKPWTTISEPESPVEEVAAGSGSSGEISATAPAFTFGGNVSSGSESASGGSKKALLAVAAVVVIAALGYATWMQWVRSSGAATGSTRVAVQPVTPPAAVPQVAPSAAPIATPSALSSTASSVQSSTAGSAAAPQTTGSAKASSDMQMTASAENAPVHPSKATAATDSAKPAPSALAANKIPTTKTAAQPLVIKNGVSQLPAKAAAIADAPAPSMTGIAPAGNAGAMPSLMDSPSNAPTPVLQTLNVSQGVSQGLLLKKPQPTYPPNAMRMHIEGAVQLMATISKNGDISAVKILSGDPQLSHAAVDAVKQWKYKPYLLNGAPVEIQTQVTVNFKLPH
jgi:periplasmic protein TonB